MAHRIRTVLAVAVGAALLGGCASYAEPGYGYAGGYGYGGYGYGYDYGPGYYSPGYVAPSVGLGVTYVDRDRDYHRRDWRRDGRHEWRDRDGRPEWRERDRAGELADQRNREQARQDWRDGYGPQGAAGHGQPRDHSGG